MLKILETIGLTIMLSIISCNIWIISALAPIYIAPPQVDPIKMLATAYTCSPEEGTADGITAMGTLARPGIVAVDPSVIPLGSKIIIENMGTFVAEDTGGAIKGNRLDIFFANKEEALNFGVQSVNIWIER